MPSITKHWKTFVVQLLNWWMNNKLHKCIYSRQHLTRLSEPVLPQDFLQKLLHSQNNSLDLKKISRLKIKVSNFAWNHLFLTWFCIIQEPYDHLQVFWNKVLYQQPSELTTTTLEYIKSINLTLFYQSSLILLQWSCKEMKITSCRQH